MGVAMDGEQLMIEFGFLQAQILALLEMLMAVPTGMFKILEQVGEIIFILADVYANFKGIGS
jgi:hypothetical protein